MRCNHFLLVTSEQSDMVDGLFASFLINQSVFDFVLVMYMCALLHWFCMEAFWAKCGKHDTGSACCFILMPEVKILTGVRRLSPDTVFHVLYCHFYMSMGCLSNCGHGGTKYPSHQQRCKWHLIGLGFFASIWDVLC